MALQLQILSKVSTKLYVLVLAYKYAYLTGSISKVSDEDGWAEFENLAIEASTFGYTNIFFACEGKVVARWGPDVSPLVADYKLPVFFEPIQLITTVNKVTIEGDFSTTVVEGKALKVQPKLKVVGSFFIFFLNQRCQRKSFGRQNGNCSYCCSK